MPEELNIEGRIFREDNHIDDGNSDSGQAVFLTLPGMSRRPFGVERDYIDVCSKVMTLNLYTRSQIIAMPCPPPMHAVASA